MDWLVLHEREKAAEPLDRSLAASLSRRRCLGLGRIVQLSFVTPGAASSAENRYRGIAYSLIGSRVGGSPKTGNRAGLRKA